MGANEREQGFDEDEIEGDSEGTGTADAEYNLVSVLYHALQGAQTAALYSEDAEEVDDRDLMRFFDEVREQNKKVAERAKELLARRLASGRRAA